MNERSMFEQFVIESNRIEGIVRKPTEAELLEFARFVNLERITLAELCAFVAVYQPDAKLRNQAGMNVRVGNHIPISGGAEVETRLIALLDELPKLGAFDTHCRYETLHPFMDGNGRSGRAIWAWQMKRFPLGFLHHFYYQTLS